MVKSIKKHIKTIASIAIAAVLTVATGGAFLAAYGAFWGAVATGALAGFASGAIMTGTLKGALRGAAFGAISAGVAFGVAETAGALFNVGSEVAHSASLFNGGMTELAVAKSMMHGLTRGVISMAQGGTFKSGFASGFTSSAFSVGTKGYGGFVGRTAIMSVVGGTASKLGGGKFSNGAVSGAFVHMFNAEGLFTAFSVTDLITTIGGALQVATGTGLMMTGIGAPFGAVMIGLGTNNIVAGTTGTNYVQEGISAISNGHAGAKTYAAIDIAASGIAAAPKLLAKAGTKFIGTGPYGIKAYKPISKYQTLSGRAALTTELVVGGNTIYGASQ